ncbi:electron transfer flavoprotein subunit alpha/FixB family protein [Chloroflexota bacterium]
MSDYQGVLVLAETQEKGLASISKELLGIGRTLADELGEDLSALLIGSDMEAVSKDAIAWGADRVYIAYGPDLASYNSDAYTAVVTRICREANPSVVLMGQTGVGRDISPRVAARLGASLSTDCVKLEIDPESKRLLVTRPVYGGNAMAVVASRAFPQMATVRPRSASPVDPDTSRVGKIVPIEVGGLETKARVVDRVREEVEGLKIEDAKVVVGGGAGISGPEDFGLVRELAGVLGGAVGATRQPCEEGWVSSSYQIGQTGKIIAPDVYIAVAISGAPQHMAGCSGSKCIVAVNRDPEANIFKVADFGIVADYKEAVPSLINKYRELKASG